MIPFVAEIPCEVVGLIGPVNDAEENVVSNVDDPESLVSGFGFAAFEIKAREDGNDGGDPGDDGSKPRPESANGFGLPEPSARLLKDGLEADPEPALTAKKVIRATAGPAADGVPDPSAPPPGDGAGWLEVD